MRAKAGCAGAAPSLKLSSGRVGSGMRGPEKPLGRSHRALFSIMTVMISLALFMRPATVIGSSSLPSCAHGTARQVTARHGTAGHAASRAAQHAAITHPLAQHRRREDVRQIPAHRST
jgi:hypothetical protein